MLINNTKSLNKEFSKLFIEKRIALYATRMSERTLDSTRRCIDGGIFEDDNETSQQVPQQQLKKNAGHVDSKTGYQRRHKPMGSMSTESTSSSYLDTSSYYDDYTTSRDSITHCALSTNDIASMSPLNALSDESVFTDGDDFTDYGSMPCTTAHLQRSTLFGHLRKDDEDDDDRTINESSSYNETYAMDSRILDSGVGDYHYNYDDDDEVFNTKENEVDAGDMNGYLWGLHVGVI